MSDITLGLPEVASQKAQETPEQIRTLTNQVLQRLDSLWSVEAWEIEKLRQRIDLRSSASLLCYGESAQRKFKSFTGGALKSVMGRDISEIGGLLSKMSANIKDFDAAAKVGILELWRSNKKTESLQAKYAETVKILTRTQQELDGWRMKLLVDLKSLDELFQNVLECYQELVLYIVAGRQGLEELQNSGLYDSRCRAEATGALDAVLTHSDLADKCKIFSERLDDLELTRTICAQTAVQIRLVQSSDRQLVASIQSGIHNSVALWQQNIATTLTMQRNQVALRNNNAQLLTTIDNALTLQATASRQRAETVQQTS